MNMSVLSSRANSKNAKAGAVALAVAAFMTLLLSHTDIALAPLRLITLVVAAFAVWAFCDEMGIRKPLNRAALVCFGVAVICKLQITVGLSENVLGRYYLLYAASLMASVLLWSVAFLHRKKSMKIVGAAGLLATLAPIAGIIIGHLVVGVGAVVGIDALLDATNGTAVADLKFIVIVERMFGVWGYVAAWLLWRGHLDTTSVT